MIFVRAQSLYLALAVTVPFVSFAAEPVVQGSDLQDSVSGGHAADWPSLGRYPHNVSVKSFFLFKVFFFFQEIGTRFFIRAIL